MKWFAISSVISAHSAVFVFVNVMVISVNGGQTCKGTTGLCCKDTETCCTDGCCPSQSAACCSNFNECCSSNYPLCCANGCCPSGTSCCGDNECCSISSAGHTLAVVRSHPSLLRSVVAAVQNTSSSDHHQSQQQGNTSRNKLFKNAVTRSIINLGPCFNYDRLKLNEKYSKCMYLDSKKIPTIGVGFNLERSDAHAKITAVGANYDKVLNGTECLNDTQIQTLLEGDVNTAVTCAQAFSGSNWNQLPSGPQSAIADMAFNLGCTKLGNFICFKNALHRTDYEWAVQEMKDSAWCGQVGVRCSRDVECMHA